MNRWEKLADFLNPRRVAYAWITGAVLWAAWLASVIFGPGNFDLAAQVVGTDYIAFYSSALMLRQGDGDRLYDFAYQAEVQKAVAGPEMGSQFGISNPPFIVLLYVPLSLLPYLWSFAVWSLVSLLMLWLCIKWLGAGRPVRVFGLSLTWFPVFASVSFGENGLLSLFLLSSAYLLWKSRRGFLAGLLLSLLLYKPQLILGVGLLWLLGWKRDWKALLGLSLGGGLLAGVCFLALPEASQAYLKYVLDVLPTLAYADQFPLWHLHALRGFWLLLFPGQTTLAEVLSFLFSLSGITGFVLLWRKFYSQPSILYSCAILLTIWVTPHAMIYDWAILLIPAVLLWEHCPQPRLVWKALLAILWLVTFVSGLLTYLQMRYLPVALQISVPVYFFALLTIYKTLSSSPPAPVPDPSLSSLT